MEEVVIPDSLVKRDGEGGTIVLVVMDGLGGLPDPATGLTELETARTPNLDALAAESSLGMICPVAPGVTPGSGPAHLSLFGYDPIRYGIGRGALSALGVDFDLGPGDVAARLNLATFDEEGRIVDRRAGRPPDDEARRVVERVREGLEPPEGVEILLIPEKEHRVVLVLRGEGLEANLEETDPQETGVVPHEPDARDEASKHTSEVAREFLRQARQILSDEERANGFLARGWAAYERYPTFEERYGLRAVAIARYPMYRGVARLVGMEVDGVPGSEEETVGVFEGHYGSYDFYFLHFKDTDTKGHDGDVQGRVDAMERIDALFPRILAREPDVLMVTGDHSTPARWRDHSWHHVPVLLASAWARPSGEAFGELACRTGDIGVIRGAELMSLALAHAGRMEKYGA